MKKIGILTFHDTTNFGSWIQTYGLYKKVSDLGYCVEIIDYKCDEIERREKIHFVDIKRAIRSTDIFQLKKYLNVWKKQKRFKKLLIKYTKLSRRYNSSNIKNSNRIYDAFMIGSDLVWDYRITDFDKNYLLTFAEEDKFMCSYAASTGFEEYSEKEKEYLFDELYRFNKVTVREWYDVGILKNEYGVSASNVCDPSLLLEKDEWESFVGDNLYGDYVLLYFLDKDGELRKKAKNYALKNKCKIVVLWEDSMQMENNVLHLYPYDVCGFLTILFHTKKIYTASYHGMMMSLIFNKQFAYIAGEPKSRMNFVAEKIGVMECNVESLNFKNDSMIDYDILNPKIAEYRADSISTLRRILECI